MEQILDFIRAAAPWVAMGLLAAIFIVRSAVRKKKAGDPRATMVQKVCALECVLALRLVLHSGIISVLAFPSECSGLLSGCVSIKEKRMPINETETGNQTFERCRAFGVGMK